MNQGNIYTSRSSWIKLDLLHQSFVGDVDLLLIKNFYLNKRHIQWPTLI